MSPTRTSRILTIYFVQFLIHTYADVSTLHTNSQQKSQYTHQVFMNDLALENKSFKLLGVTFEQNLSSYKHVSVLATFAAQNLGFLFKTCTTLCHSGKHQSRVLFTHMGICFPNYISYYCCSGESNKLISDPVLLSKFASLAQKSLTFLLIFQELSAIVPPLAIPRRLSRGSLCMHLFTV